MIVGIEGLSGAGKTTFINRFFNKYFNEVIKFKPAKMVDIGGLDKWKEYNYWMHNIIERLDSLNNYKKIILWDRFLTDAIYSNNSEYKNFLLRMIKSHTSKCVVYIDVPDVELIRRGTKEGTSLKEHKRGYFEALKSFNTYIIKTKKENNYYFTDDDIDGVYRFIQENIDRLEI